MRIFLLALVLGFSAVRAAAQPRQLPAYKVDALMQRLANQDTTYIVNFWATWCIPCVQELPEFQVLEKKYAGTTTKVLLVSLDFKEDLRFRVPTFLEKKKIAPEVVWLAETDAERFIPKIEKRWSGSIPATLIIAGPDRKHTFIERSITADEIVGLLP